MTSLKGDCHEGGAHPLVLPVLPGYPVNVRIGIIDRLLQNVLCVVLVRVVFDHRHSLIDRMFGCIVSGIMPSHTIRHNKKVWKISHRLIRNI